jgi:ABC-2 type transport system ATP-binding protein
VPLVSLRALTKRYGQVTALDELSIDLEPGIIGLVGANGAGKSTLLKILLGLLEPTAGQALVFDQDVTTHATRIRERLGYMPEGDCLPPDVTATELVAHLAQMSGLPATAARERTAEVLRHVGLYEERYRAIGGYSTGMKQRVKLAQALVHDPRLLLLDEPTNGLDPSGRDEMLELVRRTGTEFGIAVIVASHLLGEIERVCTYLVAIEGGRLLSAATLGSFTGRTGAVTVEVEEGRDVLADRLTAAGLTVRVDGRGLLIALTPTDGGEPESTVIAAVNAPGADGGDGAAVDLRPLDLIRDTIAELGLPLVRIEPERRSLEDLFR